VQDKSKTPYGLHLQIPNNDIAHGCAFSSHSSILIQESVFFKYSALIYLIKFQCREVIPCLHQNNNYIILEGQHSLDQFSRTSLLCFYQDEGFLLVDIL